MYGWIPMAIEQPVRSPDEGCGAPLDPPAGRSALPKIRPRVAVSSAS